MTFEGSFILAFAVLLGVPVLLLLARLIGWLTGTKSKPVWIVLLALVVLSVAFSIYLDNAGTVQQVKVVSKNDEVKLGRNGSWSRSISLGIEYNDPQEGSPTLLQLSCDAATYDRVQVGQTVTAHVLDYGTVLKFARLENRSTFSFLTELFSAPPRGPWQDTTATVQAVQHLTEYHYRRHTAILRWPYDVVEFSFVPAGHQQAITTVDVIEAGSTPELITGQAVRITWPQDDPRAAKIVGATPGAPWLNWFYALGETLALLAAVIVIIVVLGLFRKRRRTQQQRLARRNFGA